MFKIIDKKKIDVTEDEYKVYQEIVKSYTSPQFKGEDLFANLFETDSETGLIIFLRPPTKNFSSMEAIIFLQNVMIHQYLRVSTRKVDELIKDAKKILEKLK